jgi:UDP-N-acetylglucosamine 2-epimerase (non-hydrolysing)
MDKIDSSDVLEKLGLEAGKYILVSTYREENINNEVNFLSLTTVINNIAERYNMPVINS